MTDQRDDLAPPAAPPDPPPAAAPPPAPAPPYLEDPWDDDAVWEEVPARRLPGSTAYVVLLVIVGAVALAGWLAYRWFDEQLDPPGDPGDAVVIELGDGDTASNIASDLQEQGVIVNGDLYSWYVRLKGGPAFQAGEYTFHRNSAVWEVMETLRAGPDAVAQAVTFPVAVPEGLIVDEIVAVVDAADLPYTGADFLAALGVEQLPARWGPPGPLAEGLQPWEGLLFPDTYEVQAGEPPSLLVDRMVARFGEIAAQVGLADAPDLVGVSPYEAVIVASLIEEEARVPEDRAKIARVIYNRLEQGIPLGIDATVVYATGVRQLTNEELAVDSPYNTRINQGLPPTPIAAPGEASLAAALNPEPGDWIYYVRTDADGVEGAHTFAVTEGEFLEAKAVCTELGYCG